MHWPYSEILRRGVKRAVAVVGFSSVGWLASFAGSVPVSMIVCGSDGGPAAAESRFHGISCLDRKGRNVAANVCRSIAAHVEEHGWTAPHQAPILSVHPSQCQVQVGGKPRRRHTNLKDAGAWRRSFLLLFSPVFHFI